MENAGNLDIHIVALWPFCLAYAGPLGMDGARPLLWGRGGVVSGLGPPVQASHRAHSEAGLPQAYINHGKAMMEHQGLDFPFVFMGLRAGCPQTCYNGLLIILN